MSEDDSSRTAPEPHERRRSWLERISSAFSGEPDTREELVAILRDAQGDGLIDADTLRMMEGAISVSELTVGAEVFVLEPGDSYYFDSTKPHRFRNPYDKPARLISATTPANF